MPDEVLMGLKDAGLSTLQARVYIALLRLGTTHVGELCSVSEVARPEVYRILHELIEKDLVNRNLTSPMTYTAVEPERVVSMLIGKVKQTLESMEGKKQHLVSALQSLSHQPDHSFHQLSLAGGSEDVNRMEAQFLDQTNKEYAAIASKHGLEFLDKPRVQAIISAKKRKVRLRILTEVIPSNVKTANYLSKFVEVRQSQGLMFYMNIYDRARVLFGPAFVPSDYRAHSDRKELDIWTCNPRFVEGMCAMFESLWRVSRKFPT
ncbi:MAG TPA: helix-turn-helix domain-containing protein [Candidatus Acidoferrales bacterium]|nr:helix-turn-helix domain-containing protein [Candidatus Acidoferrales bacterium]